MGTKIELDPAYYRPDRRTTTSASPWSWSYLKARFRLFGHGLWSLATDIASGHCEVRMYNQQDELLALTCTCGRIFWIRQPKGKSCANT